MAELEKTRQQAAGISDQLSGFASVQGGARAIMDNSRSKLMDIDFGDESGNFTRMQMLIRTSSFALTQANVVPSNVFMIMQGGGARRGESVFHRRPQSFAHGRWSQLEGKRIGAWLLVRLRKPSPGEEQIGPGLTTAP